MTKLMKTATLGMSLIAGIAFADVATAADFTVDAPGMHASINFRASHLGYSFVTGRFDKFTGAFNWDKAEPSASKIVIDIDATSVNTNHTKRDEHLRSADFFDVANHPTAKFESTSIEVTGGKTGVIKGNLTIRGVTKEVAINAEYIGEGDDPWGGYRAGFTGSTMIVPADFGMPNGVAKAPLQLTLEVEGTRNK
ncbi:MAG: YceI family protein [Aestuariivirgaceae bacterium]